MRKGMQLRVLHVVTYMGRGGLETMLMNYYRHIDRSGLQFDFLVHREQEADYDREILSLGGRIHRLSRLNPLSPSYRRELDRFFSENRYSIVHSHLDCMSAIPLHYAEKNGVPVRIAHSHSSSQTKDLKYPVKLLYKRAIPRYANQLFACSKEAGEWMFGGREFTVLNNAIDPARYIWDPETAKAVREEQNIPQDALVVGHVGRFAAPKNHGFILDVFSELVKRQGKSVLMLVGDGELRGEIAEKANRLGLKDRVVFTGVRSDVPRLLQAMDVFLFPSVYEGLPVSVIEAQAAGLPCLISDRVPPGCGITELVKQIGLCEGAGAWADEILRAAGAVRRDRSAEIMQAGFDIRDNARWLEDFYLEKAGG